MHKKRTVRAAVLAGAVFAVLSVSSAQAVHDVGVFQLDRNAQTSVPSGAAGEDWDKVCPTSTPPGAVSCIGGTTAVASTFDTDGANASIFTGGGSKDDLDTTNWNWKDGSVPDKDDLSHAYAARYNSGGSVYLYFGADRFANNGDSQIGFWFFRGSVGPVAGGTFGPGSHTNGDLLILSDFTQGGAVVTVRVLEWHSPGGAINGTLDLIAGTTATPADCVGPPAVGAGDAFCATVNIATTPSPWAFTDKSGANPGSFNPGEFYEGGLNLSALGLGNECFSSFLSETRSSQSVDATLKDFVGGKFAVCGATMSTTPSTGGGGTVIPGTPVTDTATVTGSGTASPPTPTGNVTFFVCGPIASGTCTSDGTQVGSAKPLSGSGASASATSDAVNTTGLTPGRYCFRAEWPGDTNYPGALKESGTGDSECFIVAQLPTSTVTTPVDGSGTPTSTILLGSSIFDKAVVTGSAAGGDPTGQVNFFVCQIAIGTCVTGGTAVAGNPRTLTPDSNPATFTASAVSGAFTPAATGRYCFRAEYGGNTVYLPSSDSGVVDSECFVVTDTSSVTSAQDWLPNDTGTVTSAGGSPLSGRLSFTLYESSNCTGTVLRPAETFTFTNATSPVTRNTSNSTVKVSATDTVSWNVVFTSSDPNLSSSSRCETTSLTITN